MAFYEDELTIFLMTPNVQETIDYLVLLGVDIPKHVKSPRELALIVREYERKSTGIPQDVSMPVWKTLELFVQKCIQKEFVSSVNKPILKKERQLSSKKKKRKTKSSKKYTSVGTEFYKTAEWKRLRYDVLKNTNYCQCCGAKPPDVVLHVDHIKPISKRPDLMKDPNNLQVLCASCNWGKGARDSTDFRK